MVEFVDKGSKVRINPALVASLYQVEGAGTTSVGLSNGHYYEVPGTIEEVDDRLTAHYTDVRYLAFVVESLCTHFKVELTPPSQVRVEVVPPKPEPEQES